MWVIEGLEYQKGEIFRIGVPYKIKHLSSGMYLVVRKGKRTLNKKTGLEYVDIVYSAIDKKEDLWEFSYLDKDEE